MIGCKQNERPIDLPGLGLVFSSKILELSGGIIPFLILLALVTSYILGMGLPITAAYLILVILAVLGYFSLRRLKEIRGKTQSYGRLRR